MFIKELNPEYVPVVLNLSQEEKDSVQTVINMIDTLLTKNITLHNCFKDNLTLMLDDTLTIMLGLRDGFDDIELRYYKD